jgi:endonuclease/exonuclease/phosphatase family metal-dependent hydrolase
MHFSLSFAIIVISALLGVQSAPSISTRPKPTELLPNDIPFKVMIYNIWNLPSIFTDGKSRERAGHIANGLAKIVAEVDVLVFNEAFRNQDLILENPVLRNAYPHTAFLEKRAGKIMGSGIFIMSKYNITAVNSAHYKKVTNTDWFASKGLLHVRLALQGGTKFVDVIGTHMQSGNSKADQKSRMRQAEFVATTVSEWTKGSQALIFAGDLNMGPTADLEHHSVHYSDKNDALKRNEAYVKMRDGAGLQEPDEFDHPEDITRILYKGPAVQWLSVTTLDFRHESLRLSDTPALLGRALLRFAQ